MTPRAAWWIGLACVGLLLVCVLPPFAFQIPFTLAVGWVSFAARVLPGVTVDRGGLTIATVCLASFAVLAHSFLGWLHRQTRAPDGPGWSPRWTASLVAGVVLMFVAGISAAGMAHQAGWLLTMKEPRVAGYMTAARRVQSAHNLKEIGLGVLDHEQSTGAMPAGATLDAEGGLMHGWQARLLPYVEQSALFNQVNFALPWDDPRNDDAFRTRVLGYLIPGIFDDPEQAGPAPSHYAGNVRLLGGEFAPKTAEIPDGASNTILAGEAAADYKPWGYPANWRDPARGINREPGGFGGPFPGGASFLFADGSVKFLKNSIDFKVLRALSTPGGGEKIPADLY